MISILWLCVCANCMVFSGVGTCENISACRVDSTDFELPDETTGRIHTISPAAKSIRNQLPARNDDPFCPGFFLLSAYPVSGWYFAAHNEQWQNSSLPSPDKPVRAGPLG